MYGGEKFGLIKVLGLHKKCTYSEFFWPTQFSRIQTEYCNLKSKSLCLVRMWESADQSNSEYGHYLRSFIQLKIQLAIVDSRKKICWR